MKQILQEGFVKQCLSTKKTLHIFLTTEEIQVRILEEVSGVPDDIFLEVGEQIPEFLRKGKADGGIINLAGGGRVELAKGGIPRALQAALKALKSKYGDDIIKSGDELESQSKSFDDFQTRNPDPNRQMTPDELEDFEMEIGPDQLEGYDFDGTIGDAQRNFKRRQSSHASYSR